MAFSRIKLSVFLGAFLGLFCIIGVGLRMGFLGNELFIFATWFNRVLMGLVIGLLPKAKKNVLLRGAFFGFIVSFSLFLSTNLIDIPGFIAGIVYGIIIDYSASKYAK